MGEEKTKAGAADEELQEPGTHVLLGTEVCAVCAVVGLIPWGSQLVTHVISSDSIMEPLYPQKQPGGQRWVMLDSRCSS